jgi:hypothetical protein
MSRLRSAGGLGGVRVFHAGLERATGLAGFGDMGMNFLNGSLKNWEKGKFGRTWGIRGFDYIG